MTRQFLPRLVAAKGQPPIEGCPVVTSVDYASPDVVQTPGAVSVDYCGEPVTDLESGLCGEHAEAETADAATFAEVLAKLGIEDS